MNSQSRSEGDFIDELTEEHGSILKDVAMSAIEASLSGKSYRPRISDPLLKEKAGAFVTLKSDGELRGCVGYVLPIHELWDATRKASIHAAFSDPRFMPMEKSELSHVDIEVSVLGPLVEIEVADQKELGSLIMGKDGLMVSGNGTSGLLLPQVATEHGFTPVEFLEATCEKAGLEHNAWKSETLSVYKYQARIF